MNITPSPLAAGSILLVADGALGWAHRPRRRPAYLETHLLPRRVVIGFLVLQGAVGVGLIVQGIWPVSWLERGLGITIVVVTAGLAISVALVKVIVWIRSSDDEQADEEMAHEIRGLWWWTYGLAAMWFLLLVVGDTPVAPVRMPHAAEIVGEAIARSPDWYSAAFTILVVVGICGLTVAGLIRRRWKEAAGNLGCLLVIGIIVLIVYLIGGWRLVSQIRINPEN